MKIVPFSTGELFVNLDTTVGYIILKNQIIIRKD